MKKKKRKMKEAKVSKEMKTSGNICAHFQTQLGCVVVDSGRKSGTSGPERDGSAYRPELQPRSRIINISMAPVNRLFHSSGRQMAGASLTSIDPSEPRGKIQRETEKC